MNKKAALWAFIVATLGTLGFYAITTLNSRPKVNDGAVIDTSTWLTYENDEFDFRIKYPADWIVYEAPDNQIAPIFNIYPKSYGTPKELPLIHHSITPNVSVFPHGVPTEGVFGETVPSEVVFKETPMRAMDFTLEKGDHWATFAGYPYGPSKWTESGFLWARAAIGNAVDICIRDGKERPVESCDFLGSTDKIIHRGMVDREMRLIERAILGSFEFTIQTTGSMIVVTSPRAGEVIKSPLVVRGEARGNWYFEADFPITLTDWDGKIIAQSYAMAQGDWMTTDFVPFEGKIEFRNPSGKQDFTKNGYLIFHNHNASGLPEHSRAIEIPVRFE